MATATTIEMFDPSELWAVLRRAWEPLTDPAERIYWPFLCGALVLTWLVMGMRRGTRALRRALCSTRVWTHRSVRTDVGLLCVKALLLSLVRIPWLAMTAGTTLWFAVALSSWFESTPDFAWHRGIIMAVYTVTLFVVWDFSRFALHWAMHRMRLLWAFHQVHHSARVLTPLTLYRTHPIETLLYDLRGMVTTTMVAAPFLWLFRGRALELEILGINAIGFMFSAVGSNLRHSHVWLRFGPVERWVLSPAQHQLHHARTPEAQASNYGTWLALWDRMFGTWRVSPVEPPEHYGLDDANHRFDSMTSALLSPMLAVVRGSSRSRAAWTSTVMVLCSLAWSRRVVAQEPARARSYAGPTSIESHAGAAAPGVQSSHRDVSQASAEPEALELEAPQPPTKPESHDIAVEPVTILGTPEARARVAGSAHVIDEQQLARHEHDDVHRVLQTVPGVYVREEDGFGLRPNIGLRGASSDRSAKVTLMEDGVLLAPAPYAAPAAYYFPMTTRIVGIEVFKGPASIRYGPNTIGGAINLQTRPIPKGMRGAIDLAGGMRGYAKAHGFWGMSTKHFGVLLEGAHIQSKGFKQLDGGGDTGFDKDEIMAKARYNVDPGRRWYHQIDAKLGFSRERSFETYLGLTDEDFENTPYRRYAGSQLDRMSWWRTQAQLGWFIARDTVFDVQVQAYRHDFHRVWRKFNRFRGADPYDVFAAPDVGQTAVFYDVLSGSEDSFTPEQTLLIGTNDRRYASDGLSIVAHWRPTWRWLEQDIELGARVHHDQIHRIHTEDGHLMRSGRLVPEGTTTQTTTRNVGTALAGAFYVVDRLTVAWFTLTPGARVEVIGTWFDDALADQRSSTTNAVFIPGVGAHAQATRWLSVLAGVHSGFSPVSPGQPADIKPERSVNYEGGARIDHRTRKTRTAFEAIAFLNDYSNMTSECTFSSGCEDTQINRQFNAGRVFVSGVELAARERVLAGRGFWFESSASYTFTDSSFRTTFTSGDPLLRDVERGDRLPYVPRHLAALHLGTGGAIWGVHVTGSYVGEMRDVAGQGRIPTHERIHRRFVADVGGRVSVTKHASLYFNINNVANTAYMVSRRPFGARPGMPLQLMVGFKYEFS